MKIAIGCDHAGFPLRGIILKTLQSFGYEILDFGVFDEQPVDYPEVAGKVAKKVSQGRVDRGILFCGTGIGMSIAANKFPNVRAAVAWNPKTAKLAAEHNQANILCLSGRLLDPKKAPFLIQAWLSTPFAGGRHRRRVRKIKQIEEQTMRRRG